jgi:molybdopterin converting factor small subunit
MPQIRIELPEALQPLAGGAPAVGSEGGTVGEALGALRPRHELLLNRVLHRGGGMRPHVNLFLNERDLRAAQGLDTPLAEGDVLLVVASVAGG